MERKAGTDWKSEVIDLVDSHVGENKDKQAGQMKMPQKLVLQDCIKHVSQSATSEVDAEARMSEGVKLSVGLSWPDNFEHAKSL